jgi:phenylpropionate dioxygenase-like ring-hydroxylating dioxygenase large terminal subunit
MIPNQWYAVMESHEVPGGKPLGVTRLGEKLVFWRDRRGQVICQRDFCPHRGAALSGGKVLGDTLECPFHGFRYDTAGGCRLIPANGKEAPISKEIRLISYPTYEAHGFVFMWWGEPRAELPPPRFFDDLTGDLSCTTTRVVWHTHYSRAIENQLDVAHLPFVHYNTIGRGGRTLIDGPLMEWLDRDRFRLYVFNRVDDGSKPLRPEELTRPRGPFHLEFIFPNLWQNHIDDRVRIVIAFAPVDDQHTILYLRFYQSFLRVPVLRQVVNRLAMPFNLRILHQDQHVVETQLPRQTALKMGEKLVQADRPIIAYRARRQELLDETARA